LADARLAIFARIAAWYNRQRRHAARGYRISVAYEEQHLLLLQDLATWQYCVRLGWPISSLSGGALTVALVACQLCDRSG